MFFADYRILSVFFYLIETVSRSRLLFNPAKDEFDRYRDLSNTLESRIELSLRGVNFFLVLIGSKTESIRVLRFASSFQ